MTTYAEKPTMTQTQPMPSPKGKSFVKWITSTDHKTIGYLYLLTSFAWFLIGGVLALALRAELARPGMQFLSNEQYNHCLLYTSPSPRDRQKSRMPSSA